ncbi:hypothetical protein, partial [Staphylococcus aureus]|uniref:hypothetical protein n=1 Tax=Staphylococcus aureus TaxID=1280 RepID=UPI0010E1A067
LSDFSVLQEFEIKSLNIVDLLTESDMIEDTLCESTKLVFFELVPLLLSNFLNYLNAFTESDRFTLVDS